MHQFDTAADFASHVLALLGPAQVEILDNMRGDDRLIRLIEACERYVRWPREDGGIEPRYNGTVFGFYSALHRCLDADVALVVSIWDTRKMLEVTHELMVSHDADSPHDFAEYLTAMCVDIL